MERVRYVGGDPRLGRHVNHDPLSRRFPVRAAGPVGSVRWVRRAPVFDQGSLGSCTGNAAVGCLGTDPFFGTLDAGDLRAWPMSEDTAVNVYERATVIDGFPGQYPPDDTGSDGLSVAKVLHQAGLISGYRHAFSLNDVLAGLQSAPCIVGTEWTTGMWDPDASGVIHPTGPAEGGHEYVCDGFDADAGLLWFTNSWGLSWGVDGRHAMPVEEFGELLARQGDATFFVPASEPPPGPVGPVDPDRVLADAVREWATHRRPGAEAARTAVATWLRSKGL